MLAVARYTNSIRTSPMAPAPANIISETFFMQNSE
jgi:hypothetical protein